MTNPFASTDPRPEPINETFVAEANARDFSASALDFPDFEMEVPEITRVGGTRGNGPALPKDPATRAVIEALKGFEPGSKSAKFLGFTKTGNPDIDRATEKLASNVSLAAGKHGLRVTRRTMPHPHDVNKPSHERRHVVAVWRAADKAEA